MECHRRWRWCGALLALAVLDAQTPARAAGEVQLIPLPTAPPRETIAFGVPDGKALDPRIRLLVQRLRRWWQNPVPAGVGARGAGPTPVAPAPAGRPADQGLRVAWHPVGTPRHWKVSAAGASGAQVGASGRAEDRVRAFLWDQRHFLRLEQPEDELQLIGHYTDSIGRRHFRFCQRFRGVPVWPAELWVHLNPEGQVDLVEGSVVPTPSAVPDRPLLDAGAAAARGRQALGQDATVLTSELVIYAPTDRPPRLAWRLELETAADARWSVVVDARSGQVLQSYNQIPTAAVQGAGLDLFGATQPLNLWAASGLYWMVDTSKPMFDPTSKPPNQGRGVIQILDARNQPATNDPAGQPPPNLFSVTSSQPDAGWLSSAVSAATNLSTTYDFYLKVLGRNSVDGQGGTLRGVVRLAKGYDNAFWATNMGTLFFGDAEPFAGALDVVAHELTHGVTDYTARLIYFAQSGALSEAFSDIFGELAEAYASGTNDWIMGTRLNRPIRNLKDPGALRTELGPPFPAKMSQYLQTTEDNAGVHYNSTIISHAFYLLAEGLPGAIGRDDAGRIFYRALSLHLTPGAQFIDARLACLQAAEELFGPGSRQVAATAAAFDAVEIFDQPVTPANLPQVALNGPDATLFVYLDGLQQAYFLGRREAALGDEARGSVLSRGPVAQRQRPAVTADGARAVFVNAGNDLCAIATRGRKPESCLGLNFVQAATVSPDGRHFAFLLLDRNNQLERKIFYYDADTRRQRTFDLAAPGSEGSALGSLVMANTLDITLNNRYLVYDALTTLPLDDGSEVNAWGIYALDLFTGNRLTVVPPLPGRDVLNPAVGRSNSTLITFEVRDQATGKSSLYVGNLATGQVAEVTTPEGGSTKPTFTGDDSALVFTRDDPSALTAASLWRLPLRDDHLAAAGEAQPWLSDALLGTVYRRGALFDLRIKRAGRGSGSIVSDPGGIDCGVECSALYPPGTSVTLTPRADYGSAFAGWSGACRGRKPCRITLRNKPVQAVARFTRLPRVTLKVQLMLEKGAGRVISSPVGIDCGTRCRGVYVKGTAVTLLAQPDPGSVFLGWRGACQGSAACTLDLRRNARAIAEFGPR